MLCRAIQRRRGLAFTANHNGMAYTGADPAARASATQPAPAFLDALP